MLLPEDELEDDEELDEELLDELELLLEDELLEDELLELPDELELLEPPGSPPQAAKPNAITPTIAHRNLFMLLPTFIVL